MLPILAVVKASMRKRLAASGAAAIPASINPSPTNVETVNA